MSRIIDFYCNRDIFSRVFLEGVSFGLCFWEFQDFQITNSLTTRDAIYHSYADAFLLSETPSVRPDFKYGPYITFMRQRRLNAGLSCKYPENRSGREFLKLFEQWRDRIRKRSTLDEQVRLYIPNEFRQQYERERTRLGAEWTNHLQTAANR